MLIFGLEVPKNSAICCWLSQNKQERLLLTVHLKRIKDRHEDLQGGTTCNHARALFDSSLTKNSTSPWH